MNRRPPPLLLGLALVAVAGAGGAAFAQPAGAASDEPARAGDATAGGAAGGPADGAGAAAGEGERAERIVEIRVEGNRRVEREAVARALRQKVGQRFDASRTGDDLRALWGLKFFSDVQLLVQRTPQGVAYVVRVKEKPAVRAVSLSGNEELSKDDFKDTLDIKPYSILDLQAVLRNVKKVQEKYVEKGFFLAEVSHRIDATDNPHEVDVVIVIDEHAKVLVREINFIGVKQLGPAELKGVMQTREGGFLSWLTSEGTYREQALQQDLQLIQALYLDRGYVLVRVDKPVVTLSPDKRSIFITIRVEEGEPYDIGRLDFSGDLVTRKEELASRLVSRTGTRFSRSLVAKDIQGITELYHDQGYAYVNITPVTAVSAETKRIDLSFEVQKGEPVTVERIDIVGNTKTRDNVIRRQLRVYEGDLFSGSGLRRSKDKVTALGFFETVEVTHRPGRDERHVVVTVEVKEKSTGTFQLGAGFSNVEQFILTGQVSQPNFLGWGVSMSANIQYSGLRSFFQLSYVDPYFLDTSFILSVDAYKTQLDYFGFIRDAWGGTASLGYYVVPDEMSLSVGYMRERVNIEPGRDYGSQVALFGQFQSGDTSALKLSWSWDRRNNRIFPTKGWLSFFSVDLAPRELGGSYLFNRYTAYQRFYVPLPFLGIVFKTNLQAAYIQPLDASGGLPASERFFLGGYNTVRGYPFRSITPTTLVLAYASPDAPVQRFGVGGDKQLIFNAELEFPLVEKVGIRGVLFYDAGNAFARDATFFQDKQQPQLPLGLYHSVGFGFRWFSPIGPLRFEWGIPLNKRPGDLPMPFEFNIGNSF